MTGTGVVIGRSKYFFVGLLLFWIAGLMLLTNFSKPDTFFLLRLRGNEAADFCMHYLTYLGDGLFVVAVCLYLLWRRQYAAVFVIMFGYAVSGIGAQIIKESVLSPRPAAYFLVKGIALEPAHGVELLTSKTSFPSGHTASAFALATALVMMYEWWQKNWMLALLLAITIGYSRIYLGQHFPQDVLGGSIVGVFSTIGGYALLSKWNPKFAQGKKLPD